MGTVLVWRYSESNNILGDTLDRTTTTPVTANHSLEGVMFTVDHISNDNNILVSNLSFIAVMATNGEMITCLGGGNREDATIQIGSGKDH